MNFSAFNRLGQVHQLTGNTPGERVPQRLQTGGAFSPNALESLYAIRAHMDEQWDEGFVIKYRTTMQNRLNNLAKQLRDAYSALLHSNTTQVVGEGVYRGAMDDGREDLSGLNYLKFGNAIGVDPFRRWGRDTDTDNDGIPDFDADVEDNSMPDADASYRRNFFGASVEMRRLGANAAAMDQYNQVEVTMRAEEVPLDSGWFADAMGAVGRFLGGGDPPFEGKQNIANYRADLPTGGFWSSLNYLYSFNPRQLKYSYATAYSVNSEEAGTRSTNLANQDNDPEGYIFEGKLVNRQDQSGDQFTDQGSRVKWAGVTATEGYSTEVAAYEVETDWLGDETGNVTSSWKVYNRMDGTEYTPATHYAVKGTVAFVDSHGKTVIFKTENPDGQSFSEAHFNHVTVTKQVFEWNSDFIVGTGSTGSMTNDEVVDVTAGIDGSADYTLTEDEDGNNQVTPSAGTGKIARNFTQKVFKEFFELDSYNGQKLLGNGPDPFMGNLKLASYEGIERARAMSQGFMTAAQAGTPSAMEINATPVVPTDWYFAEDRGGGNIWFPFVKDTIYAEPAVPNDTNYKKQTAQFRKLINITDEEYDDIPATGLEVVMTADDQGWLNVNGVVINAAPTVPGVPLTVTIPKSILKRGDNMFGMQVDEYDGGEGIKLVVTDPAIPAATRTALNSRITTTNGAATEPAERANYWQSRVVPRQGGGDTYATRAPAWGQFYEPNQFTLEQTGTAAPVTNPLSVILMEAMNDPRYKDVFRLGLVKDLFVRGIANTPNGSTLTGTLLLNYDSTNRKLDLTQVKMTARQGS